MLELGEPSPPKHMSVFVNEAIGNFIRGVVLSDITSR